MSKKTALKLLSDLKTNVDKKIIAGRARLELAKEYPEQWDAEDIHKSIASNKRERFEIDAAIKWVREIPREFNK